jgi:very-short-patch-repair endonuclease
MACKKDQKLWDRARKQHGVVARRQLLAIGYTRSAVEEGLRAGRLHRLEWRGVYLVGRPEFTRHGRLMAAVLACGPSAVLSHASAAALWGIWDYRGTEIFLSVPAVGRRHKRRGLTVHRRNLSSRDLTRHWGIPITRPLQTIIDMATQLDRDQTERLIDRADATNLIRADSLREAVHRAKGQRGVPLLLDILDRDHFVLSESELERLFVPLAKKAGLPKPQSQRRFGPHRVDFWFPALDLVVKCDSLRYHRTPQQQTRDVTRDHAHLLAERNWIRFTHHQIAHEPDYVVRTLTALVLRLRSAASSSPSAASA